MCTYIIYSNPGSDVPLLMATTRDENPNRKTSAAFTWQKAELFTEPALRESIKLHFLEKHGIDKYLDCEIIAPRDSALGGTFLAQNKYGVIAAVNNREHSPFKDDNNVKLPPGSFDYRKMPRGGLALDAVSFDNAEEASYALYAAIKDNQRNNSKRKYSGFNLVIADTKSAWVLSNAKAGDITVNNETRLDHEEIGNFSLALWKIPAGQASLLGGYDLDDFERSGRTRNHLPDIRKLPLPNPGDFSSWHLWLKQMSYNSSYNDNPFENSICQPNPVAPKTLNAGVAGWVTVATHLMVVGEGESKWYGIDGQLLPGKLYMQEVDRGNTDNWSQIIFTDNTIREFPGRRPVNLSVA